MHIYNSDSDYNHLSRQDEHYVDKYIESNEHMDDLKHRFNYCHVTLLYSRLFGWTNVFGF